MGDKISAMRAAGVPCAPGSEDGPLGEEDNAASIEMATKIGYPVIIKATGDGGGGRGMQVVHSEAALLNAMALTCSEARAAFGNATVYMEKYGSVLRVLLSGKKRLIELTEICYTNTPITLPSCDYHRKTTSVSLPLLTSSLCSRSFPRPRACTV